MTNAELFKQTFGRYATDVWSLPENEFLEWLLNADVQQKTGRWEWVPYDSNPIIGNWHCSECGTIILHMPKKIDRTPIYKWCPMCGAKMEVQDAGSN